MQWKPEHDVIFLREVLASDLYSTRKGSTERGKIWSQIAERLNEASSCKFNVGQKSLRDHLKLLMQKYKQKMKMEERAIGIDTEMTETDVMLEEICEKEEVAEQTDETEKKKAKAEKETAEKMRLKAMETLSESQKRKKDSNEETRSKKSRKSVGDAVSYLQEKSNQEMALRREEIDLKKQEEGRISLLLQQQLKMQQEMLQMIQQQHQDQQKQHQEQQRQQERFQQQQLQTMQSLLTQQQQQSHAMLSLFERFATKKYP